MPVERSWAEIHESAQAAVKDDIRKIGVGIVVNVDNFATMGLVDVEPAVWLPTFDADNLRTDIQEAVLPQIPYGTLRTSRHLINLPPQVGDHVEIYGSDLSLDSWRAQTGAAQTVKPGFAGQHTFDSWFCVPQFTPDAAFPADVAAAGSDAMVVGAIGGVQMRVTAALAQIATNFTATQYAALSNLVDSAFAAVVSYLNSHTHTVTSLPLAGTTASPGSPLVGTASGVTSTVVTPISSQPSTACGTLKLQ